MGKSTQEFQNRIDSARTIEEFREIISELPKITFAERLYELMQKYDKKQSEIQLATGITKSLFYDITSNVGKRKPQRHQIIKIGIAMGLTVEELNELLKLANHKELYAKNQVDNAVIFGINNKIDDENFEELLEEVGATFSLFND